MAPLISVAMGLAQFAPGIARWLGGDKAGEVAAKAVKIAQTVTGAVTPDAALDAISRDPSLAFQYQQAVMALELDLEREYTKQLESVNQTMRIEATSDKWPQYSWRPFWGFVSGTAFLVVCVLFCMLAYMAVKGGRPEAMTMIPSLVSSFSLLFAIPGAILGVSAYHRGKEKIERVKHA